MAQERFYYNSPSSPLQTVDESIISSILFMYKEGTPISLIKKQFPDIKIFHNLYLHLPYEITEDICPCGNSIYKKVKGRTSYNDELLYCTVCKHDTTLECTCENCETKRNNEFEARKSRFMDHWQTYYKNTYNSSIELNNLSMY